MYNFVLLFLQSFRKVWWFLVFSLMLLRTERSTFSYAPSCPPTRATTRRQWPSSTPATRAPRLRSPSRRKSSAWLTLPDILSQKYFQEKKLERKLIDFLPFLLLYLHSQTWANDHLRIATTILQFRLVLHKWPLNYDHCQKQPLFLSPEGGRCTQVWLYSQTWANDHLRIATTCL